MQAKRAKFLVWSKLEGFLVVVSLLTFALATLVTQVPSLNLAYQGTIHRLSQISFLTPLSINRLDEAGGCGAGYTETSDGGCVKTAASPKPKASTSPKKSSAPRSSPTTSNTVKCGGLPPEDCASVPGCKVSGSRCVTDTKAASTTPPPTPAPTPSAPPGESCTGTNKNVKIQDGQYAYSGGVDSNGDYTCYQCQNGTWSEAGKCQKLHEEGKNVVAPPTDTAEGEEGGTRRNNCSDQQNGVYVTVGDGATRADGKKCMNGSWVDPSAYKPPDYVKPSPNPDASPGSQPPPPSAPATGGASCTTTYDAGHGPVTTTVPNGESALGGAATTTETGERTAVKICQNGQFVPCNEANRAGAPAVTNCTTPTVLPGYMSEGNPSTATCVLGGGYQLPAGRAIPGETGSQVCKNGKMETIPVSPNDVGNYLLGTTAGTTPAMLAELEALCLSYGNTNCTGDGLTAFATDWLEGADPAFAVEVEHRREVANLFDVATGRADAATQAALASDCKTQLGHTCSTTELSDFALKQLQTTDPAAYDQAVKAIEESKKIQEQANFVYQFYVNPADEEARKKVLALCQQQGGDCTHLETFAKSELATYDPTGELLKDANAAKDQFADTTTLFNVATGQGTSAETATLKQECLRDNALIERDSDALHHDCSTPAGLSEYALDNLEEIDPAVAHQAEIANDPQGYLEQKLNTCRHSCTDTSHNCAINEFGNAVCVDLRTVDPNVGNLTKSLGTRFDFNTFSNVNCGGLGQPCCIDQLNEDAVFKLTTSSQSCTTGTSCSGGTSDTFGSCSYDVAYSRSQATTALIQSRISGPNPADSETINKIIQNNAYVDPQSVSALPETTSSLCKASCGEGGVCAYSDSSHSYSCQRLTGNSLTQAYSQATANLPSYNTDPDSGALGQSCYRPTWFHLGAGSCDNDYLACESGTCQISDTGQSLLTVNSVSKSPTTININLSSAGTEVANLSTFIQTDPHLNSTGCDQSYSTYTSNNSCFICWDSHSKSVQSAPDPSYCSNPDMAKTLPGRSCNATGGYCAGNDTIATGGVTRTGQSDCPTSMQCFKYTPPSLGFAAGTPNQSRPGLGNSCNNAHPDSICANGLTCINGLCVDQISASFNSTYQEGLIAHGIRTNETINSLPGVNFLVDHVIAPITAAIDPDYYRATTVQADVAHSMVTNALSQPDLKASLPDDFILNTLETLHGDAKVKYQLNTLEEINANSETAVAGTGAYNTLANISFFTGAWTERFTVPEGPRSTFTADIPSGPPVDNAFYGYASTFANQDSTFGQKLAASSSFGIEIAFTAADFLTPPGLSDSIPTIIARSANEALVTRAAGETLQATAQVAFREAAQKGTATAFVQATGTVVTDALLRGTGAALSAPNVWGSAIESSIGRTLTSAVTQTGLTTFARTAQNKIITGTAQIATSVGLTTISNTQAVKTFTQGISNLASGLFTGLEKVAYSVGNAVGITSATYENKTLVDNLIHTLDITGDNLVHLSADDLFAYAASTGYKGTQAQFAQEILAPLQIKVLQNTPTNLLSTLTVPPNSLDPKMVEQLYLSTGVDFTAEAQAKFLLDLSTQYSQNPYDLKVLSDLMTQSRDMGIVLADDQIVPFTHTMLQLTSEFPQTGPLSRDAIRVVAQTSGLSDASTRSLILGLENLQSPLILPISRSYNFFSPSTFLHTQEVVTESVLTTRLQLAGLKPAEATNLAATVLNNNPASTRGLPIALPPPPGTATPTLRGLSQDDPRLISTWFDPETNQLTKVTIDNGKIAPIPGVTLSPQEKALIATLNDDFELLRRASGFDSLRNAQVDADLRTLTREALVPEGSELRIIVNPTTGAGKNAVVVPLLAKSNLDRGQVFIEAVSTPADFTKTTLLDQKIIDFYGGADNVIHISRDSSGATVIRNASGADISPTTLTQRLTALRAGDPHATPVKITIETNNLGFGFNEVLALEAGETVSNPALADMWSSLFALHPAANIDEIGTLTGRWMTSSGTPVAVKSLPPSQSLGLRSGQEIVDIFAETADNRVVIAARDGSLPLSRNLQTQALDALPADTSREIITDSLNRGLAELPANSPSRTILESVLAEPNPITLTSNFDALRRASLAELQHQFGDDVATDLYRALRVADGYNDAIYSRLSVISMIPHDDYTVSEGIVKLASDKAITNQQYSAPMQALALQEEGATQLGYSLCRATALLPSSPFILGAATGCLTPLGELVVNPRSITSDSDALFSHLGSIYATDATDALPKAKFGFTTLYDSLPLHEPQTVLTASTLDANARNLADAVHTKLENHEIAMIVDMKSGAPSGASLDATTLTNLRAIQATTPPGDNLYVALLNGDGTQALYKVDPAKLATATQVDQIGELVVRDLTPEELYAKSLGVMGESDNNKVVAYFQDRTRATNFKPAAGDPPKTVISETLVVGDANTFIKDTTFQSAGRLRGYAASPYSLFLTGTSDTLTPTQAVERALANQASVTADEAVGRIITTVNNSQTRELASALRTAGSSNPAFLTELKTFESQISEAGLAYPTTPIKQNTLNVIYDEYLTGVERGRAIIERARLAGVDPTILDDLTRRYSLSDPLTLADFGRALSGELRPGRAFNARNTLIANLNEIGTSMPSSYTRGSKNTLALADIAVQTGTNIAPPPTTPTNPLLRLGNSLTRSLSQLTSNIRTATTRFANFVASRALPNPVNLPSAGPTLIVPTTQGQPLSQLVSHPDFRSLVITDQFGTVTRIEREGTNLLYSQFNESETIVAPTRPLDLTRDLSSLPTAHEVATLVLNQTTLTSDLYTNDGNAPALALNFSPVTSLLADPSFRSLTFTLPGDRVIVFSMSLGNLTLSRGVRGSGIAPTSQIINLADLANYLPDPTLVTDIAYNGITLPSRYYQISPSSPITPADSSLQPFLNFWRVDLPQAVGELLRPVGRNIRTLGHNLGRRTTTLLARLRPTPPTLPTPVVIPAITTPTTPVDNSIQPFIDFWTRDLPDALFGPFAERQVRLFNPQTLSFPRGVDLNTHRFSYGTYFRSFLSTNTPWHRVNHLVASLRAGQTTLAEATTQIQALPLDQPRRDLLVDSLATNFPATRVTPPTPANPPPTPVTPPTVANPKVQTKIGNNTINIDLSQPTFIRTETNIDGKVEKSTYQPTFSSPDALTTAITKSQSTAAEHLASLVQSQGLTRGRLSASVTLTYTDHRGITQTLTLPVDTSTIPFATLTVPTNPAPTSTPPTPASSIHLANGEHRFLTPYGLSPTNQAGFLDVSIYDRGINPSDWTLGLFNSSFHDLTVTLDGTPYTIPANSDLTLQVGHTLTLGQTTITFRGMSLLNGRYVAALEVNTAADPLLSLSDLAIKTAINQEFSTNPRITSPLFSYIDPTSPADYQALRRTIQQIRNCQGGQCARATLRGYIERAKSMFNQEKLGELSDSQLLALASRSLYIYSFTNPADTHSGSQSLAKIASIVNSQLVKLGRPDKIDPDNLRPESLGNFTRHNMGRGNSLGTSDGNFNYAEIDIEVLQSLPESEQLSIAAHEAVHQAQRMVQTNFDYVVDIPNRTFVEIFTEWYTRRYLAPGHWLYRHRIAYSGGVDHIDAILTHIRTTLGDATHQEALALFEAVTFTGDFEQINVFFARHNLPTIGNVFNGFSDYHFDRNYYPRDNSSWTQVKNWLIKTFNPNAYRPPQSPSTATSVRSVNFTRRVSNGTSSFDIDLSQPILINYGYRWKGSNWNGNWNGSARQPTQTYTDNSLQTTIDIAAKEVRDQVNEARRTRKTGVVGLLSLTYTNPQGKLVTRALDYEQPTTLTNPDQSTAPAPTTPVSTELIGRLDSNGNIPNRGVSRNHAIIYRDSQGNVVGIKDHNSSRGTFVNGRSTTGYIPLRPGDRVNLGTVESGHAFVVDSRTGHFELVSPSLGIIHGSPFDPATTSIFQQLLQPQIRVAASQVIPTQLTHLSRRASATGHALGLQTQALLSPLNNSPTLPAPFTALGIRLTTNEARWALDIPRDAVSRLVTDTSIDPAANTGPSHLYYLTTDGEEIQVGTTTYSINLHTEDGVPAFEAVDLSTRQLTAEEVEFLNSIVVDPNIEPVEDLLAKLIAKLPGYLSFDPSTTWSILNKLGTAETAQTFLDALFQDSFEILRSDTVNFLLDPNNQSHLDQVTKFIYNHLFSRNDPQQTTLSHFILLLHAPPDPSDPFTNQLRQQMVDSLQSSLGSDYYQQIRVASLNNLLPPHFDGASPSNPKADPTKLAIFDRYASRINTINRFVAQQDPAAIDIIRRELRAIDPSVESQIAQVISNLEQGKVDDPLTQSYLVQGRGKTRLTVPGFDQLSLPYTWAVFAESALSHALAREILSPEVFVAHANETRSFWQDTLPTLIDAPTLALWQSTLTPNSPSLPVLRSDDVFYRLFDPNHLSWAAHSGGLVALYYQIFQDIDPVTLLHHEAIHQIIANNQYAEISTELLAQIIKLGGKLPARDGGHSAYQPGVNELLNIIADIDHAADAPVGLPLFLRGVIEYRAGQSPHPLQALRAYYEDVVDSNPLAFPTRLENFTDARYYPESDSSWPPAYQSNLTPPPTHRSLTATLTSTGYQIAQPITQFVTTRTPLQQLAARLLANTARTANSLPAFIVARLTGQPVTRVPLLLDTASWSTAEQTYIESVTAKAPQLAAIYADPSSHLPALSDDISAYVDIAQTAFTPISPTLPLAEATNILRTQARTEIDRLFNNPQKRVNSDKVKILNDYVDKYLSYLSRAIDEEGLTLDIGAIQSLLMTNIHTLTYQDYVASTNLLGDHGLRHLVEHNTTVTLQLLGLAKEQGVPLRAIHFLAAMEVQTNHDVGYAVQLVREGIDQGKFGIDIGHNAVAAQILRDKLSDPNHPLRQVFSPEVLALIHRGILYHDSSSVDMFSSVEAAVESAIHVADNTHAFETKLPELLFGYPESLRALRLLKTVGETMAKGEQADLIAQIRADLVRSIQTHPTLGADDKEALVKAAQLLDPIQYKFNVGRISGHNPLFTIQDGKVVITAEISAIHQQMLQLFGQEAYLQLAKFISDITGVAKKEDVLARMAAGELSFGNEKVLVQAVLSPSEVKTGTTDYQRSLETINDTAFAAYNLQDVALAAQQKLAELDLAKDTANLTLQAQIADYKQQRLSLLRQYLATLTPPDSGSP